MKSAIEELENVLNSVKIESAEDLENFKLTYLSKKGKLSALIQQFRTVAPEDKKTFGKPINILKNKFEVFLTETQKIFSESEKDSNLFDKDIPLDAKQYGSLHPIKIIVIPIIEMLIIKMPIIGNLFETNLTYLNLT